MQLLPAHESPKGSASAELPCAKRGGMMRCGLMLTQVSGIRKTTGHKPCIMAQRDASNRIVAARPSEPVDVMGAMFDLKPIARVVTGIASR